MPISRTCILCSTDDPKESVSCDCCKKIICRKCSELTETEWRCMTLKKRTLAFLCKNCDKGIMLIPDMIKQIQDLQKEIADLKKSMEAKNAVSFDSEALYSEIQDRAERSKNVLIHNVAECNSQNYAERVEYDKQQSIPLFNEMGVQPGEFKVIRLGRPGNKPRPIKVCFSDSSIALSCLKNRRKLSTVTPNIRISADLTEVQREHIKSLHQQLEERKKKGELDISIRYQRGVPRIVKNNDKIRPKN